MNSTINFLKTVLWLRILLLLLCLTACAGYQNPNGTDPFSGQPDLDTWLEKNLVPYLNQQLGRHPRFKGQPFLLVRMQGDNVMPHIDDLTEQIRDQIKDGLLETGGLNLTWRPAREPRQNPQSLHEISCGVDSTIQYYIGIDAGLTGMNRKLYVKIRALNIAEQKWISGFGQSWTGRPTQSQLDALDRKKPDDYLLGMRPLPFSEKQPDLLAAYLARNLSCLLRQGKADDLIVHVARPAPDSPRTIKTAVELLDRYLARYREVEVTDDPNEANVTILSAVHSIDKDLYQVWISARKKKGEIYLPGAETEAYVTLSSPYQTLASGSTQPDPLPPIRSDDSPLNSLSIISSFDLLIPSNPASCVNDNPWKWGTQRVVSGGVLESGSCLAVEMELNKSAYIYLLGQDARGDISRIYPSSCPAAIAGMALLQPGEQFQYPPLSNPDAAVLELAGSPGTERIYAIAIAAPGLAAIFSDRMSDLQDLCQPGSNYPETLKARGNAYPHERVQRWQNYLNWLSAKNTGLVDWLEFRIEHKGL